MSDDLDQRVNDVLKEAKNVSRGEWRRCKSGGFIIKGDDGHYNSEDEYDLNFITKIPQVIQVIKDQQAEIDRLKAQQVPLMSIEDLPKGDIHPLFGLVYSPERLMYFECVFYPSKYYIHLSKDDIKMDYSVARKVYTHFLLHKDLPKTARE